MAIVTAERLHRHMSEPQWNPGMWEEAGDLLEEIEDALGAILGSPISGKAFTETATILGSGLVNTTYPVISISALNGATIADGAALPEGWAVRDHWLRAEQVPAPTSFTMWQPLGTVGRVEGIGSVAVTYSAGWGDIPALRRAILRKGAAIMGNRHSDAISYRALDADQPPKAEPEEWTEEDLKPLELYRNLGAWR